MFCPKIVYILPNRLDNIVSVWITHRNLTFNFLYICIYFFFQIRLYTPPKQNKILICLNFPYALSQMAY